MADTKITDLTALTSVDPADVVPIVDDPAGTPITKKITVANLTAGHTGDTADAHAATAIGFTPAGTIAATTVQAAIEEVASEAIANSLLTTRGDIIRRGAASPQRLALGTSGQRLVSDGTDAVWGGRTQTVRGTSAGSMLAGAGADVAINWPVSFGDTDYTVMAIVVHATASQWSWVLKAKSATQVTIRVFNGNAGTQTPEVDVIGWHD